MNEGSNRAAYWGKVWYDFQKLKNPYKSLDLSRNSKRDILRYYSSEYKAFTPNLLAVNNADIIYLVIQVAERSSGNFWACTVWEYLSKLQGFTGERKWQLSWWTWVQSEGHFQYERVLTSTDSKVLGSSPMGDWLMEDLWGAGSGVAGAIAVAAGDRPWWQADVGGILGTCRWLYGHTEERSFVIVKELDVSS